MAASQTASNLVKSLHQQSVERVAYQEERRSAIARGEVPPDAPIQKNHWKDFMPNTSGSTKFGDTSDDTHEFTGSVFISGSVNITSGSLIIDGVSFAAMTSGTSCKCEPDKMESPTTSGSSSRADAAI